MEPPTFYRTAHVDGYSICPVGFRMAFLHPDRVQALMVQDVVAHNQGLGANWKRDAPSWADCAANEAALRMNLLSLAAGHFALDTAAAEIAALVRDFVSTSDAQP